MRPTALVLVSHSDLLARGCAEVAAQMAPDVSIRTAGGRDPEEPAPEAADAGNAGLGTSYGLVEQQVQDALAGGARYVVLLTDLGSATLTAQTVADMLDDDRVLVADAPFVEGAVAAAVAAQGGGDGNQVRSAAETAIDTFSGPVDRHRDHPTDADAAPDTTGRQVRRTVELRNRHGLHARPAAMLARRASEFDAQVRVNGVDATSVLALMGLGLSRGAHLEIQATGVQADQVVEMISADVEAGFGEE